MEWMERDWKSMGRSPVNDSGYGEDCSHPYHTYNYGGGYGFLSPNDDEKYAASGIGDPLGYKTYNSGGYGNSYKNGDGCTGDAYGHSYTYGFGNGNGRTNDYDEYGSYGCVNRDDECEDGHGNGGMYDSEYIDSMSLYWHTHDAFNAYGEYD